MLGTVDRSGNVSFENDDVNECRSFLRQHGLECLHTGWQGNGLKGVISYDGQVLRDGRSTGSQKWVATYWRT